MMSPQQNIELTTTVKLVPAHFGKFHPQNLELFAHMYREIGEESIVTALRGAIDQDLQ